MKIATYAPLGEAEDAATVRRPLGLDETLRTGVDACRPVVISELENVDDTLLCRGGKDILRVRGPADVGYPAVGRGRGGDL